MKTKVCGRCGSEKPVTAFTGRSLSPDGFQDWCRECKNADRRERRVRRIAPRPDVPEGMKWCRRCEVVKPLDEFGAHSGTKDGKQTYCKACFAGIYRQKRAAAGQLVRPAEIPDGHKFCRTCKQVLPLTAFARRARTTDGYFYMCRACATDQYRADHLARQYKMTPDDAAELLARQENRCAICGDLGPAHVDHDHATGAVRGLLCFRCNAGLGLFRDDPTLLRAAVGYLEDAAQQRELDLVVADIVTREPPDTTDGYDIAYYRDDPACSGDTVTH